MAHRVYRTTAPAKQVSEEARIASKHLRHFSSDYFTARARFRQGVEKAGGRLESLPLDPEGPENEDLSIDIGWFGSDNPRRVLLHSSGLHGVEGFPGSAIQLQLLEGMPHLPAEGAIVLVHILNPYGMAWLRRFNENNVDLNRNFLGPDEKFMGAPEGYQRLNSFLNPASPPARDFYHLKALSLILRDGLSALKQAVAGGQWDFPKGLFFGGKRLEQGPQKYQAFLTERLRTAEQVFVVDVHTGLGTYGRDVLLVEEEHRTRFRKSFDELVKPLEPDLGPAYRVRGGHHTMLPRALPMARIYFLAQEFGTYNPVKVLHALREENRWHHHGEGTVDHPTKRKLRKTFCPEDVAWQAAVLSRGKKLVQEAVEFLSKP